MPGDRTRSTHDRRQGYHGLVAQQGRVILDRDINALQTMVSGELQQQTRDVVGPVGTPDDGFAISLPALASPVSPPQPTRFILSPPTVDPYDFDIGPGTMYVGGLRAHFATPADGSAISYDRQPDWLWPTPPNPSPPLVEFVWLEVAEHEVSAVEDDDLRDVALGGPDTTQRLRLMQRVKRRAVTAAGCSAALAEAVADWAAAGYALDAATMRLEPMLRLKVGFSDVQAATSPCEPSATGGYLGADNQAIRVTITGAGTLAWGFDNASFVYAITAQPDRVTLTLAQTPVDAYHRPARNQVVEVLHSDAVLPNGAVAAAAAGRFTTLAAPYDGEAVVLNDPLTDAELADPHLFLRVWQEQAEFAPDQPVTLGSTGLTVTLQVPTGSPPVAAQSVGAYWIIAARPSTPQLVYPQQLLADFQPADGPARWVCPLAVIDWTASPGPSITDCRAFFDDLVTLSARKAGGCCTITLRPADLAQSDPTTVIDRLLALAGVSASAATICLSPGGYNLVKPLRLTSRHQGLTIEACAGPAVLAAGDESDPAFLDGLIVLQQTSGITLRGLELLPPGVPFVASLLALKVPNADTIGALLARLGAVASMVGVRVLQSPDIAISDCLFAFRDTGSAQPFAAGVLASGACPRLSIENCSFARPVTFVLGRVGVLPAGILSLRESFLTRTLSRRGARVTAAPAANTAAAAAALAASPVLMANLSKAVAATAAERAAAPFLATISSAIAAPQSGTARFGLVWVTALTFEPDANGNPQEQIVLPARVEGLSITGCDFARMTGAALTIGDTGVARVQGNTVSDCAGGFWLDSTGLGGTPTTALFNSNLQIMEAALPTSDGNAALSLLVSLLYPLPAAAQADNDATTPAPNVILADNLVSAIPSDGGQSGPGLLVVTTFTEAVVDPRAVVTVTGNQVSNRAAQSTAASGVFIGPREALVVSGNVFANVQPPPVTPAGAVATPPACLLIQFGTTVAPIGTGLVVSGNTLRGSNNLAQNPRPGFAAPLDTWAFANAVLS